jgi:hypothetical protein
MGYPTIESDLLIHTDREEFKLYTDKVLIENLKTMDTSVEVSVEVVSSDNVNIEDRDWIYNSSLFDIYASVPFIENNVIPISKAYKDFLEKFDSFLEIFKSMSQIEGIELTPFSLYFDFKNTYILKFLFHPLFYYRSVPSTQASIFHYSSGQTLGVYTRSVGFVHP